MSMQILCILVLLALFAHTVQSITMGIELHVNQKKCYGEQLPKNVLLMGEFRSKNLLHVVVYDQNKSDQANDSVVFHDTNKTFIKTAFTTTTSGSHIFCVQNMGNAKGMIEVTLAWGAEARDYSQIAKAEHLTNVTLALRKIEDSLHLYKSNILFRRKRESRWKQTNDSTAFLLLMFLVLTIILLILTTIGQIYFVNNSLRSKKIM